METLVEPLIGNSIQTHDDGAENLSLLCLKFPEIKIALNVLLDFIVISLSNSNAYIDMLMTMKGCLGRVILSYDISWQVGIVFFVQINFVVRSQFFVLKPAPVPWQSKIGAYTGTNFKPHPRPSPQPLSPSSTVPA